MQNSLNRLLRIKSFLAFLLPAAVFYANSAYADIPDAATMLANIASQIPNLMSMVTAIAYVMGMFFIYKGIGALKQFAEMRTQMSAQHELKGPLILLAVGAMLLYLPSSVQVGLSTFWGVGNANPYGYLDESASDWTTVYQDAFMVIQLIGTIAFIRGIIMLTHLSGHGGQPGTFGKALTFIIAGILCINLYDFLNMIMNTLGITGILS